MTDTLDPDQPIPETARNCGNCAHAIGNSWDRVHGHFKCAAMGGMAAYFVIAMGARGERNYCKPGDLVNWFPAVRASTHPSRTRTSFKWPWQK